MSATVHQLPVAALPSQDRHAGLNLSAEEVQEAAGGYVRPADQLRELHARGFTRAYRSKISGKVVLERGHYEAVIAGQFGTPAATAAPQKPAPGINLAGLRAHFKSKNRKL